LRESFKTWKPDVIFVNEQFKHIFVGPRRADLALPGLLGARSVRYLGHLETYPLYGNFDIYAIRWVKGEPS
jgi:hypothetical protein